MPTVFCAYCGKSFTRKEHLERHIPSHTNVKPHRCSYCHLSFARRDLLQRHHSTYHEAKDSTHTSQNGSSPQVGGRTPIACLSCASAKTGCDKKVPCSRCAEKNLPCAARYARRSSKAAAARAASAAAQSPPVAPFTSSRYMDLEKSTSERLTFDHISPQMSPNMQSDQIFDMNHGQSPLPQKCYPFSPNSTMISPNIMGLSPNGMDDFMHLDMANQEPTYHDLLSWTDFPLDVDMYTNTTPTAHTSHAGYQGLTFAESEAASATDATSARTSLSMSHTRSTSILSVPDREPPQQSKAFQAQWVSEGMMPEFDVVVAAEASWPLARCNPLVFSSSCPRTAIVHLESLEQNSKLEDPWKSLEMHLDQTVLDQDIFIEPLQSGTRDKMLAITQTFLHKALDIHRNGINGWQNNSPTSFNYLVLPPANVLESFLKSYVRSLSCYYTLIAGGTVDPNELMRNTQASTLLVLLMIAQGATAIPTPEARYLIAGLTETCRISLFDIIEKDVELSADPTVLRCALLFTILGAWSGDKWHMDIAMGQRGMYLSMLKHAGMLEPKRLNIPPFNNCVSPELQWREWLQYENTNRLVYNWVIVDQELSLFHDTAPVLSITEIQTPMPSAERLWLAKDAREWVNIYQEINNHTEGNTPNNNGPQSQSLCDLFQDFLHDNLDLQHSQLSPLELRLLLHPLQSLLCHLRQVLSCFSDASGPRRGARTVTKASTLLRLEEVQRLLQAWYDLCIVHEKANPTCIITQTNLVLYHLISLNAVTSFPEIERLARKEGFDGSYWDLSNKLKQCIYQPEEAIFHCGQVIRLIRQMPLHSKPHWWSAAIYRATIILWMQSLSNFSDTHIESPPAQFNNSNGATTTRGSSPSNTISNPRQTLGPAVAIDTLTPEHPSIAKFLWNGDGVPMLTKQQRDGNTKLAVSMTGLEDPMTVLAHCIELLDEGVAQRLSDGIKRKLQALMSNWSEQPIQMGVM